MPQLGETVIEGTITRWIKAVGDVVAEGDVLLEVSTDKVDSEIPATSSGTLTEIFAKEGDTVAVGAKLGVIGGASSAPAPTEAPADEPAVATPAAAPAAVAAPTPTPTPAAQATPQPSPAPLAAPAPSAPAFVAQQPAPAVVAPLAPPPPPTFNTAPTAPAAAAPLTADGVNTVLSPVVRKMINENALDPAQIAGTGAGGRITRADVQAILDAKAGTTATATTAQAAAVVASAAPIAPPIASAQPAAAASTPTAQATSVPTAIPTGKSVSIPFSNIRRRTAEHMVMSKATSAHTLLVVEVDYSAVDKVRLELKDQFKREEGTSLTYLPFIARATIDAIREFPHVNASVGANELIVHGDVNLGIAVDLNYEGLLVPVVHGADQLRLRAIARGVSDVAGRARSKKLTVDDLSNGTFTITNLGGYGTVLTGAVISQPQVAILSTDGVRKRPVVAELPGGVDAIVIHPVGNLAFTWDHRAFDGAYAAAFMARVRDILETRDWASEF
jgi:2-oxoglutarate dehydrogenase E2 component (dihydrolipoamide succinyltransferase)